MRAQGHRRAGRRSSTLAYLLTASPTAAEDLLQTSLEKAYVRWARIGGMDHAEAYVRRMIANTYLSGRRRAWVRVEPRDHMPETERSTEGRCWTGRCCGRWCAPYRFGNAR